METRVQMLTFSAMSPARLAFAPLRAIAAQRGRFLLFVPVLMAVGIGLYFALPREPEALEWGSLAVLALALLAVRRWCPEQGAPLLLACALVALGLMLAGLRAHLVAAPVLEGRYYGPIEGRIVKIDRSASDALRLTLDRVVLQGRGAAVTPAQIRVSLHGTQGFISPEPGLRVMLTGHLSPPPGPAEPGGFDFRRHAWFEGLGAVGYTRSPVLALAPAQAGAQGLGLHRLRMRVSAAVQRELPGDAGAFAAAIMTGDRSGIAQDRMEELRRSNLAHLLAISGLHMGLLTGFVFGLLRLMMALVPYVALRAPTRKLAALGALAAGIFYLLLSGGNVATERAFIMVAVMLVAVLLDRRAISLRSVAIAACVILALRPEALTQAGFQMSFAATVALVAVFRALADQREWRQSIPRWAWPVLSVALCSLVAGIATAPVAAASFNRIAEYGLLANLLAVPLMGLVVMPAAVLAALLAPLGWGWVGLKIMEPAILWILGVAGTISGLDGAVMPIAQPAPLVMPLMALSGLWLAIWQGRARWLGCAGVALALLIWAETPRPTLLVAEDGAVLGLSGPEGRMISRARSASFTVTRWLQADGDGADQATAFARSRADPASPVAHLAWGGMDVVHLSGQRGLQHLAALCLPGRIVVTSARPDRVPPGPCLLITPQMLRDSGALAIAPDGVGGWVIEGANARAGQRPWVRPRGKRA